MEQPRRNHLLTFLLICVIFFLTSCGGSGSDSNSLFVGGGTGEAVLSWSPPSTNTDGSPIELLEFRIYAGLSPTSLQPALLVGAIDTTTIIGGLAADTYYFAVTAIAISGAESAFSNIESKTIF